MKIEVDIKKTIKWLVEHKKIDVLAPDHEYQRAPVWKPDQEKMFIDSVFRGYSIPAFYLHHEEVGIGEYASKRLNIIDGQQRINALYRYYEGAYTLLNPKDAKFKFPNFAQDEDCPWAEKRYKDLNEDLKTFFLQQKVVIYFIKTDDENKKRDKNKIRDLFIRLQGGTPLMPQEKRDSWPGEFTQYILDLGGKHGVDKYPGHDFFTNTAKPSGGESNKRKLAAQIAMLYFNKRETRSFCDIKSVNIDQFYHQKIGFNRFAEETKRFEKILDMLAKKFTDSKTLKGKGHYAIGLVLLVDSLEKDYSEGWKEKLHGAFIEFHKKYLAAAKSMKGDSDYQTNEDKEYYFSYVLLASTKTDVAGTIEKRHHFFVEKMLGFIKPIKKDPKRNFTNAEKELIYYRDKQICQVCKMRGDSAVVAWSDAEFHHVKEHHRGGKSVISNGALVHKGCHPRAKEDVDSFCHWWESRQDENMDEKTEYLKFPPPEKTECRFKYQGVTYYGKIEQKKLIVESHGKYSSFSRASGEITGTSRNGWDDWELKLSGDAWVGADSWRKR